MIKSQVRSNLIAFFAAAYVLPLYLLLLSGFPTIDAIKVCSMIFLQIVTGGVIWNYVGRPLQFDLCETLGIGFSVGSVLSLISHQIALGTPLSEVGWFLPTAITFTLLLFLRPSFESLKFSQVNFHGLIFLPFSAALILKQWWWLIPIFLLFGLAFLFSDRYSIPKIWSHNFWHLSFCLAILTVSTMLSIYLRMQEKGWWIRSWDVTYHESKAFSVAKFGSQENISLFRYPLNYHWFGNAWIGTLTVIGELPSWLAIANVAPVISAVVISSLIWRLGNLMNPNKFVPALIVLVFAFASPAISPANPPNVVAMIWATSALVVSSAYLEKKRSYAFLIFVILAGAALAGKVSSGFLIISSFAILDFFKSLKNKNLLQMTVRATVLFALSLLVFFLVLGGPNRLGNNRFRVELTGLANFFGVESNRNPFIIAVGTIGALLIVFQLSIPLVVVLHQKIDRSDLLIQILLIFLVGICVFSVLLDDGIIYFLSNSLNFASVGAGFAVFVLVQKLLKDGDLSTAVIFALSVIALAIGIIREQVYGLNWRELIEIRGGPTPILVLITVASLYLGWFATRLVLSRRKAGAGKASLTITLMAFSIVVVGTSTLPNFFDYLFRIRHYQNQQSVEVPFTGSSQVNQASNWVRSNTGIDAVFAINRFCITKGTTNCIDPKYFAVSATAQRRILVEGPYYIVGGPYFSDQDNVVDESKYPRAIKERLDLSRGFADAPTAEITARLKELGVGWFYLFLDNTTNRDWSPYATVEYQNDEVAILKLVGSS